MQDYMDRTFAAADHTILYYTGREGDLKIPGRLALMKVISIGDGAFMDSENLTQVTFPDSIRRIGTMAFDNCKNLLSVHMHGGECDIAGSAFNACNKLGEFTFENLRLTATQYKDMMSAARRIGAGSVYLTPSFPNISLLHKAIESCGAKAATAPHVGRLFVTGTLASDVGVGALVRERSVMDFAGGMTSANEHNAFLDLVRSGEETPEDRETEIKNDSFERTEKYPILEKNALFTFDDSLTRREGEQYYISAAVKIGFYFWQSKVPVAAGGKEYFIYRRHYLTSQDPGLRYIRRDMAVFSSDGIVKDKDEAKEVYAKYKLLSIL